MIYIDKHISALMVAKGKLLETVCETPAKELQNHFDRFLKLNQTIDWLLQVRKALIEQGKFKPLIQPVEGGIIKSIN